MADTMPGFAEFFEELWERKPFPWQSMLADRVAGNGGKWPQWIDLPTASGKTACIDIAVYALAAQIDSPVSKRTAPRRIWFVVDRRIVVDEAYERIGQRPSAVGNGLFAWNPKPQILRFLIFDDTLYQSLR